MKKRGAMVFLFPSARHVSARAVAEELAALPPSKRARAWAKHSKCLLRSRSASGATREAVVADAIAFRDAVRTLVVYIESDPARSGRA